MIKSCCSKFLCVIKSKGICPDVCGLNLIDYKLNFKSLVLLQKQWLKYMAYMCHLTIYWVQCDRRRSPGPGMVFSVLILCRWWVDVQDSLCWAALQSLAETLWCGCAFKYKGAIFSSVMFPELLFPQFGSFYFPSSAFSFCPTLFFLSSLGQQEWDLQNCFARFEFTEPGVREKYKLSLHAKWKSWERSPEAVLSGLLSSRQNYLQAINSTCTDSLIWWRLFFL